MSAALLAGLIALSALAAVHLVDDTDGEAITLPTACENLVATTQLIAREGSGAALDLRTTDLFGGDLDAQRHARLQALLDACDAELAVYPTP